MSEGSGTNLGTAQGRVVITAETDAAEAQLNSFVQKTENLMKQAAGAFGIDLGIRGVKQLTDAAVAATELATAYNRQQVAAESLAGSQDQLNTLLAAYDQATGGAVDKATALAAVTKDISLGFANSADALGQFAEAARGESLAGFGGGSQAGAENQLQAAITTQRAQSLRELGLQYDQVKARADQLMQSESNLTQAQAYQQAVIDEAIAKFGDLATSTEGARTGLENAGVAWANFRLKVGQSTKEDVNEIANWFAEAIDAMGKFIDESKKTEDQYNQITQDMRNDNQQQGGFWNQLLNRTLLAPPGQFGQNVTGPQFNGAVPSWMTSATGNANPTRIPSTDPTDDQQKAIGDWWTKRQQIDTDMGQKLNDETDRYEQQRAQSESNYQEQVTESAASFAKQRMRAQEDYERSITDIMRAAQQRDERMASDHADQLARLQQDSAQRIGKLDEDLDRTIAQQRADSAEKLAGFVSDRDKQIEQDRQDSADRLVQIEQDYNDQRAQALLAHQDTLSDAAARNDAFAVFEEQRNFARSQAAAQQAEDKKVDDEKDKLQKAIDNVNDAYTQKVNDEKAALDKSIKQAQDAHDRQVKDEQDALQQRISDANAAYTQQLADARAADAQRISDMAANFTLQKNREDADQADRMNQMATHHTEEMTAFDNEHGKRVDQIHTHAGEELTALDTAFTDQMTQLGKQNDAWKKAQDAFQTFTLNSYKDHLTDMEREGINAQIRELKTDLLNPLTDPTQLANINNAITALGQILDQLPARIGTDNAPNTPQISQDDGGNTPSVRSAGIVSAASVTLPAAAQVSATGNNIAVTIAAGAVVISGVTGQTATDLAGIIDQRIYNAVLKATGRG